MLSKVLNTPVDDIVEFIKNENEVSILILKNKFNFPLQIIENWLTILEEYKILKVHYKGFEGIITYIEEEKKEDLNIDNLKEIFLKKSKEKNIPIDDLTKIWPMFILKYENDIKQLFYQGAKDRNFTLELTKKAWTRYREQLTIF